MPPRPNPLQPVRLTSSTGLIADVLPYGARLATLYVPTRNGPRNVVLGYPDPADFTTDAHYLGAVIGRVSGRIGQARYLDNGQWRALAANSPPHHLHGGPGALDSRAWEVLSCDTGVDGHLRLGLVSPDGDNGYGGTLDLAAEFSLIGSALCVELSAASDRDTPLSLTLHPYLNLTGDPSIGIDGHRLCIAADEILELDRTLIPTGARRAVAGTVFDFTQDRRVGGLLPQADPQLAIAGGYDHSYVLRQNREWDARLCDPHSGIVIELLSNQPSLHLYAGQGLIAPAGCPWRAGTGLCLEPQQFPNAVNTPSFPSPWVRAGERWVNRIRYRFDGLDGSPG